MKIRKQVTIDVNVNLSKCLSALVWLTILLA